MNKKYIYIAIGLILVILVSLYIGKSIGQKDQKDIQTKERIKVIQVENKETIKKIDSLNSVIKTLGNKTQKVIEKQIVTREKAKDIIIEKPVNTTECDDLYNKSTEKISLLEESLAIGDTIQKNLNLIIDNQNGIINNKDKIIANKDLELKLTKDLQKPRIKKYSISVQVGYGATVTTQNNTVTFKTAPYIGIGVSRAIFSF
jgi:hypothetical protein